MWIDCIEASEATQDPSPEKNGCQVFTVFAIPVSISPSVCWNGRVLAIQEEKYGRLIRKTNWTALNTTKGLEKQHGLHPQPPQMLSDAM